MPTDRLQRELAALFARDLDRLRAELDQYRDEESLWKVAGEISNPAGNLIQHICGNLQHYVGAVLCNSGYVRDREREFSERSSRAFLEREIVTTQAMLSHYLAETTEDALAQPYPFEPFGYPMTISHFLIHLYGHLHYHLGQVNYHRRLVPLSAADH